MYQCPKKLFTFKEYSRFDHSDFPAHSVFTSDVYWGHLGTSILGNSSSAANNTWSKLTSRLSFRFLWLWYGVGTHKHCIFINVIAESTTLERCKEIFFLYALSGSSYTLRFLYIRKVKFGAHGWWTRTYQRHLFVKATVQACHWKKGALMLWKTYHFSLLWFCYAFQLIWLGMKSLSIKNVWRFNFTDDKKCFNLPYT